MQNFLAAEIVATMNQSDLGRVIGEVQGFLHCGIAAADHADLLAAKEETVAGGAAGNAETLEFLLAVEAEPTRLSPGGDDDAVGHEDLARNPLCS